jgi:hypothetical protein
LRRDCLVKHVEGRIEGRMKAKGRRRIRRRKLLDYLKKIDDKGNRSLSVEEATGL